MIFTVILMDAILASIVPIFVPVSFSSPYSLLAFLVGLMPLTAFWFYSKALFAEEVSRVATLFQLIPVFVVSLSVVFLGEVLVTEKYFGIALIVAASMLISYKKSADKLFSNALKFMLPFGAIIATYTISDKMLLGYLDYWSLFFWNVLGTFCGASSLLFLPKLRYKITQVILTVGKKAIFTTFIGEGLYVIGTICSLRALSLVDASLASSLFGLQPFFVFFYTLVLSLFLPKILKEGTSKSTLLLKGCAIALMFMGAWLVI